MILSCILDGLVIKTKGVFFLLFLWPPHNLISYVALSLSQTMALNHCSSLNAKAEGQIL